MCSPSATPASSAPAGNITLNKPVVGIVADPSNGGYWLTATDGGVFSYGNAPFFGCSQRVTALSAEPADHLVLDLTQAAVPRTTCPASRPVPVGSGAGTRPGRNFGSGSPRPAHPVPTIGEMAKTARRHRCIDCGSTTPRWAGRCPSCGEWNTLVEEVKLGPLVQAVDALDLSAMPVPLSSVDVAEAAAVPTGLSEFDRVLSGGLVPGSVTLLGGEPGIGKSTLLLQVLAARAAAGHRVLLVSAEESAHQVRLRAERLGPVPPGLLILSTTDLGAVIAAVIESAPELLVIDSIQAVAIGPANLGERRVTGVPGSVNQVRECADQLIGLAKSRRVATVLVGHVTKDGSLAGPRTLEHMVDTVLSFEGDRHHALRLLLAVKHRFGPTGELGLFEMGDQGLNRVDDPGRLLLGDRLVGVPGGVVLPAVQGRRTLVVELQALVTPMGQAQPKRSAIGLDSGRLVMMLAVLARYAHVPVAVG